MLIPLQALAQDEGRGEWRTRVLLGPQLVPSSPGSDDVSIRPFGDLSRARAGQEFEFEAPDESISFPLVRLGGVSFGPSAGFEGERKPEDLGAPLSRVGFSFELGAFAQVQLTDQLRLRVDGRKGLSGHKGVIGQVSVDYVMRDADRWLFSIGPRVTLGDDRYHRVFFGISPTDAARSGLPVYRAKGGVQAVGATAGLLRQLSPRWGVGGYARYDRMLGDAANSPIVRTLGSRDQFSGGVALSYTFGGVSR